MTGVSSSAASTPTVLLNSLTVSSSGTGGAYTCSTSTTTMTPTEQGVNSLGTLFHVRWVMEIIGQAFSLPLEDIGITSNAASIYIQWLVEPSKRPPAVQKSNGEVQQQFLQTIFRHLSLLFQPKKVDGIGAAKPLLATLASKHVEVCKLVLRALSQIAIGTGADASSTLIISTATWKVLLRVLLGVTDYLLRMPNHPYGYLSEELGEALLSVFIELWLRSEIFSATLWKALRKCYPQWTHRMLAISQWSAVSLALTQRITKILYNQGTQSVVYTVHSNLVTLELSDQYAVYAWHQVLHLIGSPLNLAPSLFFRSVLGMEKIAQVFHSIGNGDGMALERYFPDGNTLLHVFGSWLFAAVSRNGSDCTEGRAQAFGVLCRIFTRPQLRNPFLPIYLHQFYAAIIDGLEGDLMSLVFIVVNCEDIFSLNLPGVRILVGPFVNSLRRIIPELEKPLRVSLNLDDLRRACYKLLCTIFAFCEHFGQAPIPATQSSESESSSTLLTSVFVPSGDHKTTAGHPAQGIVAEARPYLEQLHTVYKPVLSGQVSLGHVRYWIMELLIGSFCNEKDPGNQRYLINTLTTFTIDDSQHIPGLAALMVSLIGDHLASGKWSVDVCIVATEALRQLCPLEYEFTSRKSDTVRQLFLSLCQVITSFISRNNLALFLKPILAMFDCILTWMMGPTASSSWFAYDAECQATFIQVLVRALAQGGTTTRISEAINETTTPLSRKSSGSLTPASMSSANISPAHSSSASMILTSMPAKSLEAQLASAAEIVLSRLLHYYSMATSSPFYPMHLSALTNEILLLNNNDLNLNFVAGQPKKLCNLSREQIHALRYFILNGSTIICFIERPTEKGMASEQPQELVALIRSTTGKFTWENSLVYSLDDQQRKTIYNIGEDPREVAPLIPSSNIFAYSNVFADSFSEQAALVAKYKELESLPVHLDTVGSLYNDGLEKSRFSSDVKRVLNFKCIDNLVKEQVARNNASFDAYCKAVTNHRARPTPSTSPESQFARLLLSHFGLASLTCREAVTRLPSCIELLSDLEILDSLPERETISCAILYIKSGRQSLEEIIQDKAVSRDYLCFLHSLGWSVDIKKHAGWLGNYETTSSTSLPYYADNDVELVYHVPNLIESSSFSSPENAKESSLKFLSNDLVVVLWIEDLQEMLTLPGKLQTHAIVYICVSPLSEERATGLYRIRIMVTSLASTMVTSPQSTSPASDAVFLFGPLLDGMIIRRESLGRLVRDTAISASLFFLHHIHSIPKPYIHLTITVYAN